MDSNRKFAPLIKKLAITFTVAAVLINLLPGSANASTTPLTLGTASSYGVLAQSAVTSATPSGITGTAGSEIGVGGATAPTGSISPSGAVTLGGASISALTSAATALADNHSGATTGVELGVDRTFLPGAYSNGTFQITGNVILDGANDPNAVFVFRADSTLVTGISSTVTLVRGAQACNVFWQIGSSATLGTSSTMVGHVIAQASISTGAGSTVNGQLVAVTGAVTLGGTTIVNNSCATPAPVVTSTSGATPTSASTTSATATPLASSSATSVSSTAAPSATSTSVVHYATLHVVKVVVNKYQGTATASSFVIHVKHNGLEVADSPLTGVGTIGRPYTLPVGTYVLTETPTSGYRGVWSGPISSGGTITLGIGDNVTVTRTNYDIGVTARVAVPTPVASPTVTATHTPTTTGGKLPKTSTPWNLMLVLGGALVLVGGFGFGTRKVLVK